MLLLNTCAIREKAETKIWTRLSEIRAKNRKKKKDDRQTVAVLGCMAERLKERLLERADVVAGPDAYRDLPSLIDVVSGGEASAAFNVQSPRRRRTVIFGRYEIIIHRSPHLLQFNEDVTMCARSVLFLTRVVESDREASSRFAMKCCDSQRTDIVKSHC